MVSVVVAPPVGCDAGRCGERRDRVGCRQRARQSLRDLTGAGGRGRNRRDRLLRKQEMTASGGIAHGTIRSGMGVLGGWEHRW